MTTYITAFFANKVISNKIDFMDAVQYDGM